MIETKRLRLHHWRDDHLDVFARMHADPEVMADLGGPIDRRLSAEKLERYRAAERDHGIARWAVEGTDGLFLGYAGVMPRMDAAHPLGAHHEVGWRFTRGAWDRGYASESTRAALIHAVGVKGLTDIVAYARADNLRSHAVMERLGLVRDSTRDFVHPMENGPDWPALVWRVPVARFQPQD